MVDKDNRGFLIDLDLAIPEQRVGASGAKGKTGTRAFMAIGALLGEQHSFMHDLESFFWVLFWICIHCDSPGEGKVVAQFDKWNYADTEELAQLKKGQISDAVYVSQHKILAHPLAKYSGGMCLAWAETRASSHVFRDVRVDAVPCRSRREHKKGRERKRAAGRTTAPCPA